MQERGNKFKTCTVAVSHAKILGQETSRWLLQALYCAILRVTGIKSVCSVQDQPAHPKAAMPQAEEVQDEGTLGNARALLNNKWFSNAKTVVIWVGNYERHKQSVGTYNMALDEQGWMDSSSGLLQALWTMTLSCLVVRGVTRGSKSLTEWRRADAVRGFLEAVLNSSCWVACNTRWRDERSNSKRLSGQVITGDLIGDCYQVQSADIFTLTL